MELVSGFPLQALAGRVYTARRGVQGSGPGPQAACSVLSPPLVRGWVLVCVLAVTGVLMPVIYDLVLIEHGNHVGNKIYGNLVLLQSPRRGTYQGSETFPALLPAEPPALEPAW